MLASFKFRFFNITSNTKRFMSVRRKYPINPEEAKILPVFDYGTSKKSYRRVFVWGYIQTGALGVPYMKLKEKPEKREYLPSPRRLGFAEKFAVSTAACGFGFTAFAVEDQSESQLYGTGINTDSQISYHALREGHPLSILYFPQRIALPLKNPKKTKIRRLAAGRAHLVVLTDEGLFTFGNNSYGQCGRAVIEDENYLHSNFINHLPDIEGKKILDVECGQDHTFALAEDGSLYSCGWGADGQTGLGFFKNCNNFTLVKGDIQGEKIVKVASRSDFVLALSDKGDVFGWGNAEYNQIPTKNEEQQVCIPTYLDTLSKIGPIKDVAAGGCFCVVLNGQGQVFVWGYGILGTGPRLEQSLKPLQLPEVLFGRNDFQPDNQVVKVVCGLNYAMAVTSFGDVYAWGRNSRCCLGLGNDKDQYFPFKVSLGGAASDVFCGIDHTVAICKPFI